MNLPQTEAAYETEPKCLCLLLLDTSGSMAGRRITELNEGLQRLRQMLLEDGAAAEQIELSVISFGPVETRMGFTPAQAFYPPLLQASGATPMGEAIAHGLGLLDERKSDYRASGVGFHRPLVLLITDGASTDSIHEARCLIHTGEGNRDFMFYPVGFEGANMAQLAELSVRAPLQLKRLGIPELFEWLSSSLGAITRSSYQPQIPAIEARAAVRAEHRAG